MNDIRKHIADLSPERRALLEQKLKEKGIDLARAIILPSPRRGNRFPLSYSQRRLWFLAQLDGPSPVYNIPMAFRLTGTLHPHAVQRCVDAMVRRHESLRTTFLAGEADPVQVVHPEMPVPMKLTTLPVYVDEDPEEVAHRLAMEEAAQPFDLAHGPLIRVTLISLKDREYLLLFTMHHIVSDGWSMGVLAKEFLALYQATERGNPSPMPELPIQYPDFALWQQSWMQSPAAQEHLAYWKRQLAGLPPLLRLPTDYHRPPVLGSAGASVESHLPRRVVDALQTLAREENATLFMVLLAGLDALLVRYTGQTDISVGTPIANRTRPETEPLVGFFVNTLALRTDLSGEPTFRDVLRRVRQTALEAYAHQDIPFEKIVEELNPERSLGHTPLFQIMFALQNLPSQGDLEIGGLHVSPVRTHTGTSAFDLTLLAAELPEGVGILAEYNTELFRESSVLRLLQHLGIFLENAAHDPDHPIVRIPFGSDQDRTTVLMEWNDTERPYPSRSCVHELVEQQAAKTPVAVALVSGTVRMTYSELLSRASSLARILQSYGVGPEIRVGVHIDRSPELIIALLGILKAGGAYVPLDTDSPHERLAFIVRDAGITTILTGTERNAAFEGMGCRTLAVASQATPPRDDMPRLFSQPHRTRYPAAVPDNTMYVMYTSGSTGTPKGVMVTHRSVVNHHQAVRNEFALTHDDRVLQFFSVNFDASVEEIFPILTVGGTLILRDPGPSMAVHDLHRLIEQHQITVLELPTAYWHEWVQVLLRDRMRVPTPVRLVTIGGEQALRDRLIDWQRLPGPLPPLLNMYGPTETTIASTMHDLGADLRGEIAAVSPGIGRPFINTRVYVLDSMLNPVPAGVYGDLYIGGVGVARGYAGKPELTAEKFVPDPLCPMGGDRMYRTGDRARFRIDGVLEFAGRRDTQLKVRGYLVEPAEVEAVLSKHGQLREVAVVGRARGTTGLSLVAFYVPQRMDAPLESADLRVWARQYLPEYLVPSTFVCVDHLPKSPSGKVDRNAITQLRADQDDDGETSAPPRTPTEEIVANLWKDLLGMERVSSSDHFFEVGGHSLLATQLVARVHSVLGVIVSVRTVFESPTLAGMSAQIDLLRAQQRSDGAPPIVTVPRDRPIELSFAQQRLWFLDQLEPGNPVYNTPLAVRLDGELNLPALERSLQQLVERHEVLRTTIEVVEGRPYQRIHPPQPVHISQIDLGGCPEGSRLDEAARLLSQEAGQAFDLSQGPLFTVSLYQLALRDYILFIAAHHIVVDGWSLGVLVQELIELYRASIDKRPASLPDLPIQYADYAAWQRRWLQGDVLDAQLSYWSQQLSDTDPFLDLPVDHARPALQTSRGGHHGFVLSPALATRLERICREEGATLFMVLLAGFAVLLHRHARQTRFIIGTPIANRTKVELEHVAGFFVNVMPLGMDCAGDPPFRELVRRIRETALGAYAHQDAPFEKIVDALHLQRDMSHAPLFQVMFVLQNAPSPPLEIPGVRVSPVPITHNVAMYDLTLSCEQTAEGIVGDWEYNADLFDRPTIERMSAQFETVIESALVSPETPISMVPLSDRETLTQQLQSWKLRSSQVLPEACVHELIEARAREVPQSVAVTMGSKSYTYEELVRLSDRVADNLRMRGVSPDACVGLGMERSPDLIVALLGILKAGAAYLPLDPGYPDERLRYLCADAQPIVVIADAQHVARFAALSSQVHGIEIGEVLVPSGGCTEAIPGCPPVPENLAYVMYTSGSTGVPKGVMISHRSLLNHNLAVVKEFGLTPRDRVLQFASTSFDASAEEIFPTLLSGATLVLRDQETLPTGAEFLRLVEQEELTVVDLPTAYWSQWARELAESGGVIPPTLRLVIVGGDRVAFDRLTTWQRTVAPGTRWLNTYGPTEATIIATAFDPAGLQREWVALQEVPIGRPVSNVSTYVLDGQLEPVPVMVPGELCIGGVGVGRGYLNRPDLTAERFVPDPYADEPGSRLYRTGDLARTTASGLIMFLGRRDEQVKVRGYRVELGEIKHVLLRHDQVVDAAVVTREGSSGEKRVVAYCVVKSGATPSSSDIRMFVGNLLPDFMVPSIVHFLRQIPRTPSGKVDRRSLPDPGATREGLTSTHVPPRTEAEETLVAIWEEILGVKRVGIRDNFFELGGDSIQTIQIVAKARQRGLTLNPRDVFEHPTIEGLAAAAGRTTRITADQGILTGPAPLTPIQRWFFDRNLHNPHHWNQAALLEVKEAVPVEVLQKAIDRLLLYHDGLRVRFTETSEGWQQTYGEPGGDAVFSSEDLSALSPEQQCVRLNEIAEETHRRLNITTGPLLRIVHCDYGKGNPARLLVVSHHLMVDVVSWHILLEDLSLCVSSFMQQRELILPAKSTSLREWSQRLLENAGSVAVEQARQYWMAAAQLPPSRIPVDFPDGVNTEAHADRVVGSLTSEESATLLREVPAAYGTEMPDVLLTALVHTLAPWTGSRSLLIELESHGREPLFEDIDLSRTVGWFTTVYPLRLDLQGTRGIGEALKSVKEQIRQTPHHGFEFLLLKYESPAEATRARLRDIPQAEVSFNYLGQIDQGLPMTGPFVLARESSGYPIDPDNQRLYLLEITAALSGGELHVEWSFSRSLHQRSTLEELAQRYLVELRAIIRHCLSPEAGGYTPSDFALSGVDQQQLDVVLRKVGRPTQGS